MKKFFARFRPIDICFVILLAAVVRYGLVVKDRIYGDGLEYIVQTQSIALFGRLSIDRGRISDYWNKTNPYGLTLSVVPPRSLELAERSQARGNFGGLYPDGSGRYHYYHPWIYSLLVSPLYRIFHIIQPGGPLEYQSFRVMNTLFLCLPFLLAWCAGGSWPLLLIMILTLFSPLIPYTDWTHAELFCFCFIYLGFWAVKSPVLRFFGPAFLGLAAAQVAPAAWFFLPHLYYRLTYPDRPVGKERGKIILSYLLGFLLVSISSFYFYAYFRQFNLVAAIGLASFEYASWHRALCILFSPMIGALWFFPAAFLFIPSLFKRESCLFILISLVSCAGAAWMASATANLNSGQVGATRYAVWLIGPLWFAILNRDWVIERLGVNLRSLLFVLAAGLSVTVILYFQTYWLPLKYIRPFRTSRRAIPETAAIYRWTGFRDDAEILVENIIKRDYPFRVRSFRLICVWNLGRDRSLWVIPERALGNLEYFVWEEKALPRYRVYPANEDVFQESEEGIVLIPERVKRYIPHPVVGNYVLVRMKREVSGVESNVPVYIR